MSLLTLKVIIFGKENPYIQTWLKKISSKPRVFYLYVLFTCSAGYTRQLSNKSCKSL